MIILRLPVSFNFVPPPPPGMNMLSLAATTAISQMLTTTLVALTRAWLYLYSPRETVGVSL